MVSSESITAASPETSAGAKPVPLIATAYGLTDTGKVRTANEDQFLIAELSKAMRVWQTSLPEPMVQHGEERAHVFLVADGMGGHKAGDRASELVVLAIEQFMLNTFKWFFEADSAGAQRVLGQFQSALRQADVQIVEESKADPELQGMGTTVTLAFHLGRQVCIVHVGDSRAYLYRDGELHQLTEDHTLIADMRRSGTLGPDQVLGGRFRHVITNAIGGNELGVKVEARAFEVQPGDRLLLCSDGLTESVPNETIARLLDSEPTPQAAATALLLAANEGPAGDNITAIVARFDLPA